MTAVMVAHTLSSASTSARAPQPLPPHLGRPGRDPGHGARREAGPALVLSDLTHLTSEQKREITPRAGVEISYDPILFNGRGRREDLAPVPGEKLTDKGCLPAVVMAEFGGDRTPFNGSALPAGVFSGCKATSAG
ncbi:hypothetical protein E4U41_003282 [Claviceps citrina]|nr:hypothetical protein E4U41_003282 [Claviceps citrina]